MDTLKKVFAVLFTSVLVIIGSTSTALADTNTSITVNGTLYSQSKVIDPDTNPPVDPTTTQPTTPTSKPKNNITSNTDAGYFGKFGDQNSELMILGGLMLILAAVGIMIQRRL